MNVQFRKEKIRNELVGKFRREIESYDGSPQQVEYRRCLKKIPIPEDKEKVKMENEKYPLNSRALSVYDIHLHPKRDFKRTYDFTKLDRVYYGEAKYRQE